jgi:uncharacterized membrane protein YfhO
MTADNGPEKTDSIQDLHFVSHDIPFTYKVKNIEWYGSSFKIKKNNATLYLSFQSLPESETYIRFRDFRSKEITTLHLQIKGEAIDRDASARFENNIYPSKSVNFLYNLGYGVKPQQETSVTFDTRGTCTLGGIEVLSYPLRDFNGQRDKLSKAHLKNLKIVPNHISGAIDLTSNKYLCIPVPYDRGWTAKVDGKVQPILHANVMLMGLALGPGRHTIELSYITPGIRAGLICSVAGILLFIAVLLYYRRRNHAAENTLAL